MARILVVDDEVGIRELLSEILYDEGHTVELAENAAQARAARLRMRPDLVLLDIWMPDTDGVSLLKEWASQGMLDMPVIMMSGHATIDTAVEATRIGAMDFLEKPITLQRLLKTVAAGLARGRAPHPAAAAHPSIASAAVALEDELDPPPLTTAPAGEVPVTSTASWAASRWTSPARGARRVRAHLFRIPPGPGKPQHDPGVRAHRPRTHPPLPQAQAIGHRVGPQAGRMKILIMGAGRVGTSVAENLVSEENDITVIDSDPSQLQYLQEHFDLRVVHGDGAQVSVLETAGAADTDLFIACAASDTANMVACKIARQLFNIRGASPASARPSFPSIPS